MTTLRGYMLILGAATLWGLTGTLAKLLITQKVSTFLLVQTRVTFSFLFLLAGLLLLRPRLVRIQCSDLLPFAIIGVVGVAGANFTYYYTISAGSVATAILMQYTAPILVMVYAVAARTEPITPAKLFATLLSFGGCAFAVGSLEGLSLSVPAFLSGLGSSLTFAFLSIAIKKKLEIYSVWTITLFSFLFASLFWMIINPPWEMLAQMEATGIVPTPIGFAALSVLIPHSMFFTGLKYATPSQAVITSTVEPVIAIGSAAAILGESITVLQGVGGVMVIMAIVVLQVPAGGLTHGAE